MQPPLDGRLQQRLVIFIFQGTVDPVVARKGEFFSSSSFFSIIPFSSPSLVDHVGEHGQVLVAEAGQRIVLKE